MNAQSKKRILSLLLAGTMLSGTVSPAFAMQRPEEGKVQDSLVNGFSEDANCYEIYPIPHSVVYPEGAAYFTMTPEVNVVAESGIDSYTKDFLEEILTSYGMTMTTSSAAVAGKTNILLGLYGDADKTVADPTPTVRTDLFTKTDSTGYGKYDPYMLVADTKDNANGVITIVGQDTDSVYYGLATLQMMFSSFAGQKFLPVQIEDYSNNIYRGVIEGFYGGWDVANRASVMRMGRDIKMNTFVYASKTDKYHTSLWYELYPEDQLEGFAQLVELGKQTKVEFVWSVHLGSFFKGGVSTDPANEAGYALYNQRFEQLTQKFDQLYSIGVRQFHVLNDDFGSGSHADAVNLLNRIMTDYVDKKGDCAPIVYCPRHYNNGRAQGNNLQELASFRELDPRVNIYWTGSSVNSPLEQANMDLVYNNSGHNVVTWLNYPCNEHSGGRGLFLGHSQAYLEGAKGLEHHLGIISNPCNKAQVSKVGIYQLMCWNWNNESYDDNYMNIWEDCFKYLQPEVYDAYLTIARNVGAAPGSGVPNKFPGRNIFPESDYLMDSMAALLEKTGNGTLAADDADLARMRTECANILAATQEFRNNCTNDKLKSELGAWLNNLDNTVRAVQKIVEAAAAVNSGDYAAAWDGYNEANQARSSLNSYGGTKRLKPFITDLMGSVSDCFFKKLSPQVSHEQPALYAVVGGVRQPAVTSSPMLDGNLSTAAKFTAAQQAGDYYGVDLGMEKTVRGVSILQGENDGDANYYHNAVLEYSVDGIQWMTLASQADSNRIGVTDLNITARYIRLRQTEAAEQTLNVREFSVDTSAGAFADTGSGEKNAMDGNLLTAFTSKAAGELVYELKEPVQLASVSVIQNTLSNGTVSVLVDGAWQQAGTLDSKVWVGDTSQMGSISAIKLTWDGNSEVSIAEILLNGQLNVGGGDEAPLVLPSIYTAPDPEIEVEVAFGTPLAQAGLPVQGTVTLNNGKEVTLPVVWTGTDYDPQAPKEYAVTGHYVLGDTITNPGGFALHASVTVRRDSSEPAEPFTGNLALMKKHQVSGETWAADGNYKSASALDGNSRNRWCAGPDIKEKGDINAVQKPGVEWIIVDLNTGMDDADLGGTNELTNVTLKCYSDKSWPTKYDIYVSDAPFTVAGGKVSGGTKVASASFEAADQKGHADQVTPLPEGTTGRYVCVVFNEINKYATGATGISVAELEVHGTKRYTGNVGPEENLLEDCKVYASGMETSSGFEPWRGLDGNSDTRWSSNRVGPEVETDSNGAWIVIDLGEDVADVTKISMSYFNKTWSDEYWIQVAGNTYQPTDYSKQNISGNTGTSIPNKAALTGQNAKDAEIWTTIATVKQSGSASGATHTLTKADFTATLPAGTRYLRLYFEKGNEVVPRPSTCIGLKELTVTGTRLVPPAEPNVQSVAAVTARGVLGTEFAQLELPQQVAAVLADGTSVTLAVTWDAQGYDPNSTQPQKLTGTLQCTDPVTNTEGVQAELTLTLTAAPSAVSAQVNPPSIIVPVGTGWSGLNLPSRAAVQMSDGSAVVGAVTWTESDYAPENQQTQTIHGTLSGIGSSDQIGVTITVVRPDSTAPGAPAGVSASGITRTEAVITWNAPGAEDVAGYRVYLDDEEQPVKDLTSTTCTLSGLTPDTAYSVAVSAYDASGNESPKSAPCQFRTQAAVMHHVEYIISNASAEPKTESVMDGASFSFKLTADEGYVLPETIAVTMDGTELVQGEGYIYNHTAGTVTIMNVTGEVLVRVEAVDPNAPETVTVTFESNGGSPVSAATVEVGTPVSRPTDPTRDGYIFGGWYTDESYTVQWNFSDAVNEDMTLYAKWDMFSSISYAITVERSDNGAVTASRTRAPKGLTITLTVKPDEGCKLDTLTVTDKNGNEVKLTEKGDGKYTFTMPGSAVTVKTSFVKDDGSVGTDVPFTDVKAGDWFYEAVKYAYDNKLMDGTSSTTFAPLMTTNRAMIVTILWRLEGEPETDAKLSFTDVESGLWYTDAVNWAAAEGIVKGYSDTVFAPNDTVTREQLATILYRYAEYKEYDVSAKGDLTAFTDGAKTSSWAAQAMEWAVGSKLLSGKGGSVLDPTGTATRAEVAQILMRFAENGK